MGNISEDTVMFEHRFWLQIMGDHARIIFLSLAPTESEYIMTAQKFIISLDELLKQAQNPLTPDDMLKLNQDALALIKLLREFKLELLRMSLSSDLKSHLSPTHINDMVNELEEYYLVLKTIINGKKPLFHPLHYHLLWLSDSIGHAAIVSSSLDPAEKDAIVRVYDYEMQFNELFYKAYILKGCLRTQLKQFSALERLNNEAGMIAADFMGFLDKIRDQRMDQKILGSLTPLMADHMSREACYYLWKLSHASEIIRRLDCDPTRPRLEA
mgnify:CR=1 FL=1